MGKTKGDPNFSRATDIGKYVAGNIDYYRKKPDPKRAAEVLKKLKVIFNPEFGGYLKVVDNEKKGFTPSFFQKIGKRRAVTLKEFLCKIDAGYKKFHYKQS